MSSNMVKMVSKNLAFMMGISLGAAFIAATILILGPVIFVLFGIMLMWAAFDLKSGQIPIISTVPMLIIPVVYTTEFMSIYLPIFGILLIIFLAAEAIKRRFNALDRNKTYFGMADVLVIPFTITLANILHPFFGIVAFVIILAAEIPLIMRKKFCRFLPWLILPTIAATIAAMIAAMLA